MFVISVLMRFSPWASCHGITQVRRAASRVIMDGMDDPVADAQALVEERFPAARAAFLGGGVLSPRRTSASDLDIVVVIDGPPAPFRESLRWRGWPVELFVHRLGTTAAWFAKDVARRRPTLPRMCADGVILVDADGTGAAIRAQAQGVLEAGPPPVTQAELDAHRYGLTDLLDDLTGSTDAGETIIISWTLVTSVAQLALLTAGAWLGGGKWLLRDLRQVDLALADELLAARENPAELARIADQVLDRAGGRLWAGYRQPGQL
jgi:hypothetical protein